MRPTVSVLFLALELTACTDTAGHQRDTSATPPSAATATTPQGAEPATPAQKSLPCNTDVQRELVGRQHGIVGHSFAWPEPFTSPPLPDRRNKILWELLRPEHSSDTADLLITASLNDSEVVVHRRIEGYVTPGRTRPSIIDVPEPGCWTFSLTWGRERDLVAVQYRSG